MRHCTVLFLFLLLGLLGGCVSQQAFDAYLQQTETSLGYARNEASQLRAALMEVETNEEALVLADQLATVETHIAGLQGSLEEIRSASDQTGAAIGTGGAALGTAVGGSAGGIIGAAAIIASFMFGRRRERTQ